MSTLQSIVNGLSVDYKTSEADMQCVQAYITEQRMAKRTQSVNEFDTLFKTLSKSRNWLLLTRSLYHDSKMEIAYADLNMFRSQLHRQMRSLNPNDLSFLNHQLKSNSYISILSAIKHLLKKQ